MVTSAAITYDHAACQQQANVPPVLLNRTFTALTNILCTWNPRRLL